jgi:hypothetical protein
LLSGALNGVHYAFREVPDVAFFDGLVLVATFFINGGDAQ